MYTDLAQYLDREGSKFKGWLNIACWKLYIEHM